MTWEGKEARCNHCGRKLSVDEVARVREVIERGLDSIERDIGRK